MKSKRLEENKKVDLRNKGHFLLYAKGDGELWALNYLKREVSISLDQEEVFFICRIYCCADLEGA